MTFSYTFAWYSWEDWEKLLDWAAWRGVNIQLAWVGYEKIFLESFRDLGLTDAEILPFFSGPAFQSWNRFGNCKQSWGDVGNLPMSWIDAQFELQKKIVARMVELGITPVLPAFPGFVPDAITRVRPDADVTRGSDWNGFGEKYSQVYSLSPTDETFAALQRSFVEKQIEAFGNVTNIYTLDQFNELEPSSGESEYLANVAQHTYKSLTDVNPAAVWLLQGWLFFAAQSFWSQERIEAFLGGVEHASSMLILDLDSESMPQWQRTNSYAGKPWIWCQLHDFGGNMNLFGKITNITVDPIEALEASDSLVGFGLTPEAYEGNEVVYDLLLDQAWSASAIGTGNYFKKWAGLRYGGITPMPSSIWKAWDLLRQHVYDNKNPDIPSVGVGIYQLRPSLSGLVNRTGHWPAPTALHYDPSVLKEVWSLMLEAGTENDALWGVPAFELDFVDVTRQVMANAFINMYEDLVSTFNAGSQASEVAAKGGKLLKLLDALDDVLSSNEHFTLRKWLRSAETWADTAEAGELMSYNARSQVTVWFHGAPSLNDYSARAWSGLTGSYYQERWAIFVEALKGAADGGSLDETGLEGQFNEIEKGWLYEGFGSSDDAPGNTSVRDVVLKVRDDWPDIFSA